MPNFDDAWEDLAIMQVGSYYSIGTPFDPVAPEKKLLFAMLDRAIKDSRASLLPLKGNGGTNSADKIRAIKWLRSDSIEPFSARWVCDILGLSLSLLRTKCSSGEELEQRSRPRKLM